MQNLAPKNFLSSLEASWASSPFGGRSSTGSRVDSDDINKSAGVSSGTDWKGIAVSNYEASGLGYGLSGEASSSGALSASSGALSGAGSNNLSTLREGCVVRGAFECQGDLVVEGFVEGDLLVKGSLTVTETGSVRANIRASSVMVFGRIVGDVHAEQKIELHVGSQLRGNIKAPRLLLQDGVVFDGRCTMTAALP
ncbi:MAG TPA: polymer-forming cytoskeletal protein [Oligoflexia bacterium]|nr:polymer-forming cytoskeletal protein [Oligoflexia bacterium]HMP48159.1 polymer-forming cytoskeletal protein [Oligoflexia bacterium]